MITSIKNEKIKANEASKRLAFKERKELKYSFVDDDVKEIFDELLASNAITLLESKRPT